MKKLHARIFIYSLFFAALTIGACKSKSKENVPPITTADTSTMSTTPSTSPPVIISNEELKKGVTDALKDYTSVKGDVSDSVITLSGEIKRADWQRLNPTLNTLHPKRINSENLTIK